MTKRLSQLLLALMFSAGVVNAQAASPPGPQNFALPPGAILMWPSQPNAPQFPGLPSLPEGFTIPEGYNATGVDKLEFGIGPEGIRVIVDPRMLVCKDGSDEYSHGGKNARGQTCECPAWIAWLTGCSWTDE